MSMQGNIAVESAMDDLLRRADRLALEKGIQVPQEFLDAIKDIKKSALDGWY